MSFCRQCGYEVKEGMKFCPRCGQMLNQYTENQGVVQMQPCAAASGNKNKLVINTIVSIIAVVVVIAVVICGLSTFFESRAIKEAKTLIKQQVYTDYGEVPEISAKILYKGRKKEVIIVKFKLPELGFDGSYAVASYKQSGTPVGTSDEMQYDYDFKGNIERVKTVMGVD